MSQVLITGATGLVGGHLLRMLGIESLLTFSPGTRDGSENEGERGEN